MLHEYCPLSVSLSVFFLFSLIWHSLTISLLTLASLYLSTSLYFSQNVSYNSPPCSLFNHSPPVAFSHSSKPDLLSNLSSTSMLKIQGSKEIDCKHDNGFEAWKDTILDVFIAHTHKEFAKGSKQYTLGCNKSRNENNI